MKITLRTALRGTQLTDHKMCSNLMSEFKSTLALVSIIKKMLVNSGYCLGSKAICLVLFGSVFFT